LIQLSVSASLRGAVSQKPVIFVGSSKAAIKQFTTEARRAAGWQLQAVQEGLDPDDWKPMPSIAPGVKEIRIHRPHEHRIIYIAQLPEAIYVLSAFEKKTEKTLQRHLNSARKAYAEIQRQRKTK
jgi:phage-related protein